MWSIGGALRALARAAKFEELGPISLHLLGSAARRTWAISRWPSRCCGGPSSSIPVMFGSTTSWEGCSRTRVPTRPFASTPRHERSDPKPPMSWPMPWRIGAILTSPSQSTAISTSFARATPQFSAAWAGCSRPKGCPKRLARRWKPPRSRSVRRNGSGPPSSPRPTSEASGGGCNRANSRRSSPNSAR